MRNIYVFHFFVICFNFFFKGFASLFPEPVGKVILAATYMLVCWLFLYFLYKKKIFLKV